MDKPLAIVDVETTGSNSYRDRIIEIGIIRIENGKKVGEYNSLINPETYVSPYIEMMTGIHQEDLQSAPIFYDEKEKISSLLEGALFVAHNARFDYGFIKHEYKRLEESFSAKTLCTVRLSRLLFPQYRRHSLSELIERFQFTCEHRHRALDDADVLWQFLQLIGDFFPQEKIAESIDQLTGASYKVNPAIQSQVEQLPESPGVYIFYDTDNMPLYIGKSTNIKQRVISHFTSDFESGKQFTLMKSVAYIDHQKTAGELGALLLESRLIKEQLPVFNRKLRRKKQFFAVMKTTTDDGFFTLHTHQIDQINKDGFEHILGIFKNKKAAQTALAHLSRDYGLCNKLLGLEQTRTSCFGYKLRRCKGACVGEESAKMYNLRFTIAFEEQKQFKRWPFIGPIEVVEQDRDTGLQESFQIDKWCLNDQEFDIDSYKIISSHLKHKKVMYRTL